MNHHESFYKFFRHEWLSFGWKNAKKYVVFFLQIFAIMGLINALPNLINLITHQPQDTNNIGTIIAGIVSLICSFGLIKIYLSFSLEHKPTITNLFDHDRKRFARRFVAKVLAWVLIVLGCILLVIPGIYVAARLYLYELFVVDQEMSAIEAISASREMTKGHVREIIGISLLSFGIILLGLIPVGIGLLWAVPTVTLARAKLYRKLTHSHHHTD